MRLTAKELEQMKSVDIGAVAPESLPDVSGMAFDTSLPREERIVLFLQAYGFWEESERTECHADDCCIFLCEDSF